jgi:NADPH:quinone reductase-like Zn-dependent oxidoreductase
MQALRFNQTGDLKYLELVEIPTPTLGKDEVLIEVKAGRLNRNDISNVMGRLPYTTIPRTPGRDYSGVIQQGPAELIGKEVWGTGKENGFIQDGSHAAFMKVHRSAISMKPQSLSFVEAANCGTPYSTAWGAIQSCHVREGTRIVIIGANGAVGNAAVELAKKNKANVLGLVRSEEHLATVKEQDVFADLLPNTADEKALKSLIWKYFPQGPDVIFDTTGHWLPSSISALGKFGQVAVIVAPGNGQVTISVRDLYRNGASIVGVNSLLYSASECATIFDSLAKDFDQHLLRAPQNIKTYALKDALGVYKAVQDGSTTGMHVFIPEHGSL